MTFDTKSSQIARTCLWPFSLTFGIAYSPLSSATLSCSIEVTLGNYTNNRIPPRSKFKKVVKSTGYTYACNSLTNFDYEGNSITGNGNQVNFLKLIWKNLGKHIMWIYFCRVFPIWNHCTAQSAIGAESVLIATLLWQRCGEPDKNKIKAQFLASDVAGNRRLSMSSTSHRHCTMSRVNSKIDLIPTQRAHRYVLSLLHIYIFKSWFKI